MHAIVITSPGGPEVLEWQEVPEPVAGPGDVLIDVAASAVNRADILQRLGFYPPPEGAPPYPGLECSGTIAALGEDVVGWHVGDEVCALLSGGGYASRIAVPAGQILPVPKGIDVVVAAALPEVICTVWSNVFMLAGLRPEESFLVHGGAGGIGTAAIQLTHLLGARVFTTAGTQEKRARCVELGAEIAIDYRNEDFVEVIKDATGDRGVDVILDNMGASYLARNIDVLATGGRLAVIGMQGGVTAELNLATLMGKRAAILSTTLRARPTDEKATIVAAVREHVWPLLETGRLAPVIDRVVPMRDAAEAQRALESGECVGKVVLRVE